MSFLKSFVYAFRGLWLLISTERNFRVHTLALAIVVAAGFYFNISRFEWMVILLISAIVMGLEGANSALEKLCDEVTQERKESIRTIKDIAAGAVLIAAIIALVIGFLLFKPYFT